MNYFRNRVKRRRDSRSHSRGKVTKDVITKEQPLKEQITIQPKAIIDVATLSIPQQHETIKYTRDELPQKKQKNDTLLMLNELISGDTKIKSSRANKSEDEADIKELERKVYAAKKVLEVLASAATVAASSDEKKRHKKKSSSKKKSKRHSSSSSDSSD